MDFGGGGLVSAGSFDAFLAKYGKDGTHLWSQRFGNAGAEAGQSVTTDGSGGVVFAGIMGGAVDFGGGALAGAT